MFNIHLLHDCVVTKHSNIHLMYKGKEKEVISFLERIGVPKLGKYDLEIKGSFVIKNQADIVTFKEKLKDESFSRYDLLMLNYKDRTDCMPVVLKETMKNLKLETLKGRAYYKISIYVA